MSLSECLANALHSAHSGGFAVLPSGIFRQDKRPSLLIFVTAANARNASTA